jgi:hypothetical protein
MYTNHSPKKYPVGMDVITPNGVMYIEWKALCVKIGVTKAKALLRNWETARDGRYAKTPHKTEQGVFIHSSTYGCMDYWGITKIHYRGSLPNPSKGKPMETAWSLMKKALLYKLF